MPGHRLDAVPPELELELELDQDDQDRKPGRPPSGPGVNFGRSESRPGNRAVCAGPSQRLLAPSGRSGKWEGTRLKGTRVSMGHQGQRVGWTLRLLCSRIRGPYGPNAS